MTDQSQLDAILHGAAFAEITDRAFLRITGSDATRWLNGMVTNNIAALAPGEGNYNFLLNAQGRIQGDCTIYREPSDGPATYLLEADSSQLAAIEQILEKFIIMDDVELAIVNDLEGIVVAGQQALTIVMALGTANRNATACSPSAQVQPPQSINLKHTVYAEASVSLMLTHSPTVPRIEIWSNASTTASILTELRSTAATDVSPETLEAFRIYSGTPKYGIDIRDRDLPQETAQPHALHFAKGCYLGQEIVERIRSRGNVHRTFTKFTLTGSLPSELPAPLEANAKPAGEITSATQIGDTLYALGYARREALDTHATLTYPGGKATPLANWNTGKLETGS